MNGARCRRIPCSLDAQLLGLSNGRDRAAWMITMLCHWPSVSRNLNFAASFARRFLELTPKEKEAALFEPGRELIPSYMAWDLALAICQARELVRVLEEAEKAWISILGAGARVDSVQNKDREHALVRASEASLVSRRAMPFLDDSGLTIPLC